MDRGLGFWEQDVMGKGTRQEGLGKGRYFKSGHAIWDDKTEERLLDRILGLGYGN